MPECIECKREVLNHYQTIKTKRHSEIHICDECLNKNKRGAVASARHSEKPTQ